MPEILFSFPNGPKLNKLLSAIQTSIVENGIKQIRTGWDEGRVSILFKDTRDAALIKSLAGSALIDTFPETDYNEIRPKFEIKDTVFA